ncbi:MAG: P-loop NTPase [Candidatus Hodarchaeota archaeon]
MVHYMVVIAVASGKGGTGKTAIATSLALVANNCCQILDCDVEAPNVSLYLPFRTNQEIKAARSVPEIDTQVCTYCGECAKVCQYNAIVIAPKVTMTFPELCHSCGACFIACSIPGAIKEIDRVIGTIRKGKTRNGHEVIEGRINIGEAIATPLIKQVKENIKPNILTIIDSPPGNGCPVVESISGADFVFLVTEPTPFGVYDLSLAIELTQVLNLSTGVIINREGIGSSQKLEELCRRTNVPILLRIPFDRKIAEEYSRGRVLVDIMPSLRRPLQILLGDVVNKMELRREFSL